MSIPITSSPPHQKTIKVKAAQPTVIAPHSVGFVSAQNPRVGPGQLLLFEPTHTITSYAAVAGGETTAIPVVNSSDVPRRIPRNLRLGQFVPLAANASVLHVDTADPTTAAALALKRGSLDQSDRHLVDAPPQQDVMRHPLGVAIYNRDPVLARRLAGLVNEFADVFRDTGFVDLPVDQQMRILLCDDLQGKLPGKCKAYSLGEAELEVRTVVDASGKTIRKGRMVVDIRRLNDISLKDAYPVTIQDQIFEHIAGASILSTFDAMSFYWQWLVHPDSRWAMNITTPEGQYTSNRTIQGYKNSNAYVQRHMDIFLQGTAAKSYCDDVVVPSASAEEHLAQLRRGFTIFRQRNISLGPSKSYLGFPSTELLGKHVNAFGLSTPEQKLDAIRRIEFPASLRDLEH
ncbi:uncharacterized protein DNG_08969 [Cephalotrichum gorgonifer]|uniref:Reverse transcriptase domain-containing protein n=1 Tax=Cephalotrichum gorgonifer TaxID=2041049 RepID=A0AAE8N7N3_9PEZI|nr:uncharacterized protein DNG_08969 [Cephalotrichum gorgonifer]